MRQPDVHLLCSGRMPLCSILDAPVTSHREFTRLAMPAPQCQATIPWRSWALPLTGRRARCGMLMRIWASREGARSMSQKVQDPAGLHTISQAEGASALLACPHCTAAFMPTGAESVVSQGDKTESDQLLGLPALREPSFAIRKVADVPEPQQMTRHGNDSVMSEAPPEPVILIIPVAGIRKP